ncbi:MULTISPECIES: hypothetical protein [Halobacteriales]|uniref:hypothetical protein n=1 Tax=Halobacteriales TaxID=2235 RepID=UPI0011138DC5|nr:MULTISPECIES: hypothetical protein [Halobacteria]
MSRTSTQSIVTRTSIIGGLVGGLVHAGVAVLLWNRWFDNLWELLMTKPLNGAYILLGMFLLGFVPVLFYVGEKVISPAIIVAAFLLLSGFGSWLAGPVRPPSAVPTPFALYILLWVGVVALAGVTGRLEYRRKQRAASA